MRFLPLSERRHRDLRAALLLLSVIVLGHLPEVGGLVKGNPLARFGGVTENVRWGWVPGFPYIDPNIGQTTQTLGRRAALEWLAGRVPWWNSYAGVGIPLVGDMQSAAFFPPTLFYLCENGHLYIHIFLQFVGGMCTYVLLRQLLCLRLVAFVGAVFYALNGTFAWFAHASFNPVAFLPMMLMGVEATRKATQEGGRGGWEWLAMGLALSLYAGFPETAFINGLLVAAWTLVRGSHLPRTLWYPYSGKIVTAGFVGLALAAPLLVAFFEYLPQAFLGTHTDGGFAYRFLLPSAFPTLFIPYLYGNIFSYSDPIEMIYIWGNVGGYLGSVVSALAIAGLTGQQERALRWTLGVWIGLSLAKTFGVYWAMELFNVLPFIPEAAFYRYAYPSWEMAAIVLAAFAFDDLVQFRSPRWLWYLVPLGVILLVIGCVLFPARELLLTLSSKPRFWVFFLSSIGWAITSTLLLMVAATRAPLFSRSAMLVAVAVIDALLLFMFPRFASPRDYRLNLGGVEFLRKNLGFSRFYSLGPIAPNYGPYFGIASINHIDAPIPARWVEYIAERLDSNNGNGSNFLGTVRRDSQGPSAAEELVRNLANYEGLGVKYIVAPTAENPFLKRVTFGDSGTGNVPLPLNNGDGVVGYLSGAIPPGRLMGLQVFVGTYNGHANGVLQATLQTPDGVRFDAVADVARAADNQFLTLEFPEPVEVKSLTSLRFQFTLTESTFPVALWRYSVPAESAQRLQQENRMLDGHLAIKLIYQYPDETPLAKPAYQDAVMSIYELSAPKSYFTVPENKCAVQALSREVLTLDCPDSTQLVRRELYFPGWSATVNGEKVTISVYDNLFQQIPVPAGRSTIQFVFSPLHLAWAAPAAAIAFGVLLWHGMIRHLLQKFQVVGSDEGRFV